MISTLRRPVTLVAFLGVVVTACTTPTTPDAAPANALAGVWELATVNGAPLPSTAPSGLVLLNLRLDVSAAGTFTESFAQRLPGTSNTVAVTGPDGVYTLDGSTVSLSYGGASLGTGTVDAETLVLVTGELSSGGRLLIFVRR